MLTSAPVSGNPQNTDHRDLWAAFKKKSTTASVRQSSKSHVLEQVNLKKTPNLHICLASESELSKGRDFNKKRHWI